MKLTEKEKKELKRQLIILKLHKEKKVEDFIEQIDYIDKQIANIRKELDA